MCVIHTMEIDVLRATWRDASVLAWLDRRCFPRVDAYGWFTYLGLCLWPGMVALKAVAGKDLVGFVAGDPHRLHGYAVVITLSVDPAWRRHGIGQRLMRECETRLTLPVIRLQVRQSNLAAIRLYQKLGYAIVGDLPHYYVDEDGYLMEKMRR